MAQPRDRLLALPLEVRLVIYSYCLPDVSAYTISSAQLVGDRPDVVYRLYGNGRSPLNGLPYQHEAVIQPTYAANLLSVSQSPTIHACDPPQNTLYDVAPPSLLFVNRQINTEISTFFNTLSNTPTDLFVNYPHGLHVLKQACPHLLRQAQSIHIAGEQDAGNTDRNQWGVQEAKDRNATSGRDLGTLVKNTLGPNPIYAIRKLELRIYFPGRDSYSKVWSDDSLVAIAIKNIYGGNVDIEVWRGNHGTGVYLSAKPTGEEQRMLSTVWRKLNEGGYGQAKCGEWVVDERWPAWTEEYERISGSP